MKNVQMISNICQRLNIELNNHIKFKCCDTFVGPMKIVVFQWDVSQTICLCRKFYEVNGNEWAKINPRNLLLYIFCATDQYTQTYISCSMHNIYHSLLPHVFKELQTSQMYTAHVASSHM